MHLGRGRARDRSGLAVLRPQLRLRELLGQVLRDGEAVPDGERTVEQGRDPAGGGVPEDLLAGLRLIQRDHDLLERLADRLQGEPGPHRPG
jgi:hypothetical protein